MPSADQVPVKNPHSTMQWHMWVVLIAGSTGSALRAVRPPNLHIVPDFGAILLRRQCDGFLVAFALGHHGPRRSCDLVGKCDRGDSAATARALLLGCLGRDKPRVCPGDRLADGLGASGVILLPFDIGLHIGRRHQPYGMAKGLQLTRPMMR